MLTYQIRHCELLVQLYCQPPQTSQCALQRDKRHYLSAKLITVVGGVFF